MSTLARPSLRPRRRLRRPLPYWSLVAGAALLPALVVGRLTLDASAERTAWGPGEPTVVVLVDVAAGQSLGPDDVAVRLLPRIARPDDALVRVPDGAVAAADLAAGEAVVASRLAPSGTSPAAARLPPGTRGMAIPDSDGLPLRIGDTVDVLATVGPGSNRPTVTVALGAKVVEVGEATVVVAVDLAQTERVAFALAAGVVTLALSGPR